MAVVSDMVFSLLVLATGGLAVSTLGFAVAWIRARERAIRAEQRATRASGGEDAGGEARFDRLEHAVETIALDVERMAEGQRFLGRLLAERPAQEREPAARPARVTTPH